MEGIPHRCSALTHKVLWHQTTGERLKEFQDEIAVYAYTVLAEKCRSVCDHESELIVHLYPKIPRIIISFTYQGISFEHYLMHTLYLQRKTLLRDAHTKERYCSVMYDQQGQETLDRTMAGEAPPQYTVPAPGRHISQQRLLILIMVNALNIPGNMVRTLAEAAGIHEDALHDLLSSARMMESRRCRRREALRVLRDRYYTEMLYVQQKILMEHDRQLNLAYRTKLARTRKLLMRVRSRMHLIPANLSHSRVSELLGIPKGTVDSSVYYMKKRYLSDVD